MTLHAWHRRHLLLSLTISALLIFPARASEGVPSSSTQSLPEPLVGTYDIYLGGLRLAEMTVSLSRPVSGVATHGVSHRGSPAGQISQNRLSATGDLPASEHHPDAINISMALSTEGLASIISDFSADAHFSGVLGNKIIHARAIHMNWTSDADIKSATLTYDQNFTPLSFTTSTEDGEARAVVTPLPEFETLGTDTVSPLLSMFRPLHAHPCRDAVTLFDGQRLSALTPSPNTLSAFASSEQNTPRQCQFKFVPIAGHTERTVDFAQKMSPIDVTFLQSQTLQVPQKIIIETRYGYLAMRLRTPFAPKMAQN